MGRPDLTRLQCIAAAINRLFDEAGPGASLQSEDIAAAALEGLLDYQQRRRRVRVIK